MALLFDQPLALDDFSFEDLSFGQSNFSDLWEDSHHDDKLNLGLLNLPTPPLSPEQEVKIKKEEVADYEVDWYMSANPANFILNDRILYDDRIFSDLDLKPTTPDFLRPDTPPSPVQPMKCTGRRRRESSPILRVDEISPEKRRKFSPGEWPVVKEERVSPPPQPQFLPQPFNSSLSCPEPQNGYPVAAGPLHPKVEEEDLLLKTEEDELLLPEFKNEPLDLDEILGDDNAAILPQKTEVKLEREVKTEDEPAKLAELISDRFRPLAPPKEEEDVSVIGVIPSSHSHSEAEPCTDGCMRRASHMALERRRRNDLNRNYASLKEVVPSLCQTDRVSKVLILKRAAEYIGKVEEEEEGLREELRAARGRQRSLINKFKLLYRITQQEGTKQP